MHFRLSLKMEVNTMSPDQTAPKGIFVHLREQSDQGPYFLQFKLPEHEQICKQIQIFMNGEKRVNIMPCDIGLNKKIETQIHSFLSTI